MSTTNPSREIKEVENFIKKKKEIHEESVNSQHWQLKNMLKIDGKDLVYSNGNNIISYNYKNRKKKILHRKLSFPPTSLFINDNFVAAGGAKGQIVLFNRFTNNKLSATLNEAINNHLLIDSEMLYVSSNDKTLKIFDTSLQPIKTIFHTTQVNYCSISPDKKYLIIVGDNNEVVLYSNKSNGCEFIKKLKSTKDGGFSVSWNSTSNTFAVGTQDGHVCLWDIRSDDKLQILNSKQSGSHKGAVRNVFFTQKNSLDLLCFTEQFAYLTLFDSRTFEKRQIVNVYNENQITGSVLLENESKIFVSSDSNITEFDVNTVSRRVFEGC